MTPQDRESTFHDLVVAGLADGDLTSTEKVALEKLRDRLGVDPQAAEQILREVVRATARELILPPEVGSRFGFFEDALAVVAADGRFSEGERRFMEMLRDRLGIAPAYYERLLAKRFPEWRPSAGTTVSRRLRQRRTNRLVVTAAIGAALLVGVPLAVWGLSPHRRAASAMSAGGPLTEDHLRVLAARPAKTLAGVRAGLGAGGPTGGYEAAVIHLCGTDPAGAEGVMKVLGPVPADFLGRCLTRALESGRIDVLGSLARAPGVPFGDWCVRNALAAGGRLASESIGPEEVAAWGPAAAPVARELAARLIRDGKAERIQALAVAHKDAVRPAILEHVKVLVAQVTPETRALVGRALVGYQGDAEAAAALLDGAVQAESLRLPRTEALDLAHGLGARVEDRIRGLPAERLVVLFKAEEAERPSEGRPPEWRELLHRRYGISRALAALSRQETVASTPALQKACSQETPFAGAELLALVASYPECAPQAVLFACRLLDREEARPVVTASLRSRTDGGVTALLDALSYEAPAWLILDLLQEAPVSCRAWIRAHWKDSVTQAAGRRDGTALSRSLSLAAREVDRAEVAQHAFQATPPDLLVVPLAWARTEAPAAFERTLRSLEEAWFRGQSDEALRTLAGLCERQPDVERRIRALLEERAVKREIEGFAKEAKDTKLGVPRKTGAELRPGISIFQIDNDTGQGLALYFDGPETFKILLPAGDHQEVEFRSGSYTVYAAVGDTRVEPQRDTQAFRGRYHNSYYIRRTDEPAPPPTECRSTHRRTRATLAR